MSQRQFFYGKSHEFLEETANFPHTFVKTMEFTELKSEKISQKFRQNSPLTFRPDWKMFFHETKKMMEVDQRKIMSYANYINWKSIPLIETPLLSVVIPAYNESERIIPTIGAISSYLCDTNINWELIVVDDGSTDDTAEQIAALKLKNLRLFIAEKMKAKAALCVSA